jgi:hypothetical protein
MGKIFFRSIAMWRRIKVVFAVSIFTLSLGMTISSSYAQDGTRGGVGAGTTITRDDNDGFDLGWIGLAGLAGLIGLMPRDRHDGRDHDLKR